MTELYSKISKVALQAKKYLALLTSERLSCFFIGQIGSILTMLYLAIVGKENHGAGDNILRKNWIFSEIIVRNLVPDAQKLSPHPNQYFSSEYAQ